MRQSRLLIPLLLSAGLFSLYFFVRTRPIALQGFGDLREGLFGKDLRLLLFAAVATLIFLIVRSVDALAFDVVFSRRRRSRPPTLLREMVSLCLLLILFGWSATAIFGARWTTFLTSATVVAVFLGLALQDTLGNLFAGIALHMEDTYSVGDVIKAGEFVGTVERMSWRATRIRTVNNNFVVMPNSFLSRERIEVFPNDHLNARLVSVPVSHEARPSQVISLLEQAARNVEGVAPEVPAFARVGAFSESGVVYEIKYWTRRYENRDNIDAALRRAVWYALKRNNLLVAFPIRTVYKGTRQQRDEVSLDRDYISHRLAAVDVLAPLSSQEQAAITSCSRVRNYAQGETILRFGQAGNSMFIIHEGRVSVRVPIDGGAGTEVAQVDAGSFFGEMALLTGEARAADVVAVTDTTLLEVGKECLEPILKENPALAAAITKIVAERRSQLISRSRGAVDDDEDHHSLLDRIRSYFGIDA